MTRGEDFIKKRKFKNNHCSVMSNIAWCDLKNDNIKRLHDFCPNPRSKCRNQITFTPKQFQLEGAGFKNTMKKIFRGCQTAWNEVLEPAVNVAAPFIGLAVSAKTKNPRVGQATNGILKSFSGGKVLSLTDMHGNELGLKIM